MNGLLGVFLAVYFVSTTINHHFLAMICIFIVIVDWQWCVCVCVLLGGLIGNGGFLGCGFAVCVGKNGNLTIIFQLYS